MLRITPTYLSFWANNICPSPTLQIDAKAKAMQTAGQDVCLLGTGEPDFDTPLFIKEACIKALDEGKTKYIPSAGLLPLRAALADNYKTVNKLALPVKAEDIIISPGGKFSCLLAILSVCSPQDEVIIPAPYWVSYPEMAKLALAIPKVVQTKPENNFKLSASELEASISPKTRLLILNSPSNPTGQIYTRKELEALVLVCLKNNVYILSDEIYEHLLYDNASHISPAALSEEAAQIVFTASGFSKTFAMTGWRLGTLVAPPGFSRAVDSLQSHMTSNATTFAQYGALAALTNKPASAKFIQSMLETFNERRHFLHAGLSKIPGIQCSLAPGAFYLFPNVQSFGLDSHQFADQLLSKQQVAVVPGTAFGTEGYLRVSYTCSTASLEKAIERIKRFCSTLNTY